MQSADREATSCDRQGSPRTVQQKVVIVNLRRAIENHNYSKFVQQVVQNVGIPLWKPLRPSTERNFGACPPATTDYFLRPRFFYSSQPLLGQPCRRRPDDGLPRPRWPFFVPSSPPPHTLGFNANPFWCLSPNSILV